ncbi:hypothetical protein LTR56_026327 [Elasticomyces elasticus]|nr:hypothetical protein LTR56_026327 [Elasticomyces elasticus]KAK3618359.1 hypothetical protein LTR22_026410 [Elasticomyces elasticus]KAK4903014.1 hypothetical protein LTR49_026919 [Elasticomyces elasticus]KAK5737085.1 hypothetical protein LTS12_025988 [Elasticomyces elasticus]
MANDKPAPRKKVRKSSTTPLALIFMKDGFADEHEIKCDCEGGVVPNGQTLFQCKLCNVFDHINCMVGEEHVIKRWEADNGYKCAACTLDNPKDTARFRTGARSSAVSRTSTAADDAKKKTNLRPNTKRSGEPHSTPSNLAEEDFYASLGKRAKAGSSKTSKSTGIPAKSLVETQKKVAHASDEEDVNTPSTRTVKPYGNIVTRSEQTKSGRSDVPKGTSSKSSKQIATTPANRHVKVKVVSQGARKSAYPSRRQRDDKSSDESSSEGSPPRYQSQPKPATQSKEEASEEAFYASLGARPVIGSTNGKPRPQPKKLPITSTRRPARKRKVSEALSATSELSKESDTSTKDTREEIEALRRRRMGSRRDANDPMTPQGDGTGDPVKQWMTSPLSPSICCSCVGGPAGKYTDYIICVRCSSLQHNACIPSAEADTIAKGLLCEPCRNVRVEKMYSRVHDSARKAKVETESARERFQRERDFRNEKLKVIVAERFWKEYCDLPKGQSSPEVIELTSTCFDDGKMVPIHPAPAAWVDHVLARIHKLVSPGNKDLVNQIAKKDPMLMSLSHPDRLRAGLGELAVHAVHHGSMKGKKHELGVLAEVLGLEERGTYW